MDTHGREKDGASVNGDGTYSLSDVVSQGFEATCIAHGAHYFWHRTFGVRIDRRTHTATLLTDPTILPDANWVATSLGVKELEAAAAKRTERESGEAA